MSKRPYVYLCGPIRSVSDAEAMGWRNRAKSLLHPEFEVLDPLRGYKGDRDYITERDIITRDLEDIRQCRAVLRMYDGTPSEGSAMETFYAAHVLDKPVVIVNPNGAEMSKWMAFHSVARERSLEAAAEYLKDRWLYPHEQPEEDVTVLARRFFQSPRRTGTLTVQDESRIVGDTTGRKTAFDALNRD